MEARMARRSPPTLLSSGAAGLLLGTAVARVADAVIEAESNH
jgi:hypothetical protein